MSSHRLSPVLALLTVAMLLFGLTAALSMTASYDVSLSQGTLIAVLVSVGLYLVVSNLRGGMLVLGFIGALAGLALALFFVGQFAHRNYPEVLSFLRPVAQATTFLPDLKVYIHQNSVATLLEMLLPLVIAALFLTRPIGLRLLWGVGALVILYAIILTYSRGAWVGLVLAGLIGVVVYGLRLLALGKAIVFIVIGGLIVIVGVVAVVAFGSQLPFMQGALTTLNSRLELYRNGLHLASDYAFTGIGLGDTFAMVYSRFSLMIFVPFLTYVFNLPLAIWLGQGIGGFVAFALIVILFYAYVVRALRRAEPSPLFHGAWLGVTATLIHGLVDARQYVESPLTMPLLFFGLALAVATGRQALYEAAVMGGASRRRLLVRVALVMVALVVGFVIFNKRLTAMWYTNQGAIDETHADGIILPALSEVQRDVRYRSARGWYQKALTIDPDYANANRRLGNLLVGQDQFEAALPLLEKAYAAEPDYHAAIKGLGLVYTWVGRTGEAACVFKNLSNTGEMLEELYNWQNFRYEQQQSLLSAYALETAAILEEYQQTNMDVWLLIGDRFREAGQPERAQAWYSRALQNEPNHQAAASRLQEMNVSSVPPIENESDCP